MDNLKGLPSLNFLHTFESVARHLRFTKLLKQSLTVPQDRARN